MRKTTYYGSTLILKHRAFISASVGTIVLTSISYPLPNLDLMCYTEPIHFIYPSTIIAILEDKASASSIEWVVRITELYFLSVVILWIIYHINLLAYGSIPVDGSSRNTIGGFPIKNGVKFSIK